MTRRSPSCVRAPGAVLAGCAAALLALAGPAHAAGNYPITPQQRATAQQVAQAGVPLSELAPNAPDAYTVKRGDTLWDISSLFLKSPWRWPELWGMNMDQIRNPHLIYPGQQLVLEKIDGRARLRLADGDGSAGTVKLSPRIRSDLNEGGPIAGVPLHLIAPFLNEAVVFNTDELATAPRIVAAQEGRVLLSKGETAYVRGELNNQRDFRVFRSAKPLLDPTTREVLGYEAPFLGTAEFVRPGGTIEQDGKQQVVPDTVLLTSIREEIGVGDRLAPVPPRDYSTYAPHAPGSPIAGRIVSIYGQGLNAGQNQIVALNRGAQDGVERGHVFALWRDGREVRDTTDPARPVIKLPDERHGLLFVFSVFDRVSYALIVSVLEPVKAGDRFTQP
ncbi:MAG: LysM domain-containing protein [Pseudomonadota bacterium]